MRRCGRSSRSIDTFDDAPAGVADPAAPGPGGPDPDGVEDGAARRPAGAAAVDALLAAAGPDSGASLLVPAELRQLGGALGRPAPDGGALSCVDGAFALFSCGIAATPEMGAAAVVDATRVCRRCSRGRRGREYLNFAEEPVPAGTAFEPAALRRLRAIRAAVDPSGLFVANHAI